MLNKFFYISSILSLFVFQYTNAAVGCSTYNGLYPNTNGAINPSTGNIYYNNSGHIAYRYYQQDPNCGIRDNRIKKYSPATPCDVMGVRNWGELVNYNPRDNNCVEVPFDDYVFPVLLIIGGVAYLRIRGI